MDSTLELLSDKTQIAITKDLWDAVTSTGEWSLEAFSLLVELMTKFEGSEHFVVRYVHSEDFPPYTETLVIERTGTFEL